MPGTIIEQTIKEIVDDLIINNPEYGSFLFKILKDLRNKKFPIGLVNAIFQKPKQFDIDVYDAYCFMNVWADLFSGKIARAKVWIGHTPKKNVDIEGNNEILSKLVYPFKAEFLPSKIGDDGYFKWLKELELQIENISESLVDYVTIEPTAIPLEVGYSSSFKTFEYLTTGGGAIARYPYNSEDIFIFYNLDYDKDFLEVSKNMYKLKKS
jgi:hypothetical protein